MSRRVVIFGAGGAAREVRWLIEEINRIEPKFEFLGYLVADVRHAGDFDSRNLILGDFAWLEHHQNAADGIIIAPGSPKVRLATADLIAARFSWIHFPSVVSPDIRIHRDSCTVGEGVIISVGVTGTINTHFEPFAVVGVGSTIGHEARIGRGSVLESGVHIAGGVVIGAGVEIGMGATVLPFVQIGDGARIGAGTIVGKDVPAGATVGEHHRGGG
jgi:acetyltransferase-like isoleucine patch superfamily enzyme